MKLHYKHINAEPNTVISDDDDNQLVEIANLMTVDKIVDSFVDIAFREMQPNNAEPAPGCHECLCKDQVINNQEKLLNDKESLFTTTIKEKDNLSPISLVSSRRNTKMSKINTKKTLIT